MSASVVFPLSSLIGRVLVQALIFAVNHHALLRTSFSTVTVPVNEDDPSLGSRTCVIGKVQTRVRISLPVEVRYQFS